MAGTGNRLSSYGHHAASLVAWCRFAEVMLLQSPLRSDVPDVADSCQKQRCDLECLGTVPCELYCKLKVSCCKAWAIRCTRRRPRGYKDRPSPLAALAPTSGLGHFGLHWTCFDPSRATPVVRHRQSHSPGPKMRGSCISGFSGAKDPRTELAQAGPPRGVVFSL